MTKLTQVHIAFATMKVTRHLNLTVEDCREFAAALNEQLGQQAAAPRALLEKCREALYNLMGDSELGEEIDAALAAAPSVEDVDAGAKVLAKFIGYSWEGLTQDARPKGFPMWAYDGIGQKHYQGGKEGLREIATAIAIAVAPSQRDQQLRDSAKRERERRGDASPWADENKSKGT